MLQRSSTEVTLVVHRDERVWSTRIASWWRLFRRTPTASPFSSPAWLRAWWEHFGRPALRIIEVVRDGESIAIVPLARDPNVLHRWLLLGTGNSDYLGALVDPRSRDEALAVVSRALSTSIEPHESLALCGLRANEPLRTCSLGELRSELVVEDVAPSFDLPASTETLIASLPHGLRVSIQKARRRLERDGCASYETAVGDRVQPCLEDFFALHGSRWAARGEHGGVLDDETVRRFHRAAAPAMDSAGLLRLHVLRVGEKAIAAFYGFAHGETVFAYLGGFDPAYARYSPGQLMLAHAMEQAIRAGDRVFDFLRGNEAYKYQWGASDRSVWRRLIVR
jgi:CelD/BcsL family acetyltransferase involved in cellulose biosynthesis